MPVSLMEISIRFSDPHQPGFHAATFIRELDRVGQHVPNDLMYAVGVTKNDASRSSDSEPAK